MKKDNELASPRSPLSVGASRRSSPSKKRERELKSDSEEERQDPMDAVNSLNAAKLAIGNVF